jgi:hypothetical protein
MRIVYTADTQRSQQEHFLHCVSYKHGRNEKRVQEMRYTGVESVQLVQGRNQSWVLLRTVMNIWVPQKKRWGFLAWLNDYESVPQEGLSSMEFVIKE